MVDQKALELDDLRSYIIVGVDSAGHNVLAASQKLSLEDMGAFHGRLGVAIQGQLIQGALTHATKNKPRVIS